MIVHLYCCNLINFTFTDSVPCIQSGMLFCIVFMFLLLLSSTIVGSLRIRTYTGRLVETTCQDHRNNATS
jgi:hypothetical protein